MQVCRPRVLVSRLSWQGLSLFRHPLNGIQRDLKYLALVTAQSCVLCQFIFQPRTSLKARSQRASRNVRGGALRMTPFQWNRLKRRRLYWRRCWLTSTECWSLSLAYYMDCWYHIT